MADEAPKKPDDAAPAPAGDGSPQGHDEWAAHMQHYQKSQPWMAYAMKCYEASQPAAPAATGPAAAPSATNAAPPAMAKQPDEQARMQHDSEAIRYSRIEAENRSLASRLASIEAKEATAQAERYVIQLEAEGYSLDRAEEVKDFAKLDDAGRQRKATYIRKHFQRDITKAAMIRTYEGPVSPVPRDGGDAVTKDELAAAVQYARDHNLTGDDRMGKAIAAVRTKR